MICDYWRYFEPSNILDYAAAIYSGFLNAVGTRPRLMVESGFSDSQSSTLDLWAM
jgi:hypothetical protein